MFLWYRRYRNKVNLAMLKCGNYRDNYPKMFIIHVLNIVFRGVNMPGKSKRVGLNVFQLFDLFPDEMTATEWFEKVFWAEGRVCGHCGSDRTVERKNHKPMPYRCKDCRKDFSVRTGTVMQHSKIPLRKWAVAIYQITNSLKGTSSMKLHRDLDVSYACTWHLSHRIREAWDQFVDEEIRW
ncbi:MAG: transposase [Gammaproteobacteria bacterium]|nr:transposase [Gammaproteobacteria bacterium]MYF53387.1 transposase [Gammaproteobacteria bacterium]MYK44114.1 transposase [Gammaproteobacteria bacterium]